MINPDKIKPKHGFYPSEVYSRVPSYVRLMIIILGALSLIAALLFRSYEPNDENTAVKDEKTLNLNISENNSTDQNESSLDKGKPTLFKTIQDRNVLMFSLCCLFMYYLPITIVSTFKFFTNNYSLSEDFLFYCLIVLFFFNGTSRFLWGYLYDKVGLKPLVYVAIALNLLVSSTFYFIIEIKPIVVAYMVIIGCIGGAPFSLIPMGVYKRFGQEIGGNVYSIVYFGYGVAGLISPTISRILDLSSYDSAWPYFYLYTAAVVPNLLNCINVWFIDLSPTQQLKQESET